MSDQRLFSVNKVGLFCDGYGPATEKRRGETTTIIKANFRIQPFDAKLATAIDEGLADQSGVRASHAKGRAPSTFPRPAAMSTAPYTIASRWPQASNCADPR